MTTLFSIIIASHNLNAFFSLYAQLVENVFSTLTPRSLPFSCQAKSYYLTIDRSNFSVPAIRLRIKILLFTATSFPIGGLPIRFLSHLPSLTFLRTCARGGAWVWCMGLLRNVTGNSTLSSGQAEHRTRGRLSAWKFECDELTEKR